MSATRRRAVYLDELGRLLHAMDPVDRIEAVDAVRVHLDTALARVGPDADEATVDAVLGELGTPEEVAGRALAGEDPVPTVPPADAPDVGLAIGPTRPTGPTRSYGPSGTAPTPGTVTADDAPASPPAPVRPRAPADLSSIPRMEWPEEPQPRPGMTRRWLPPLVAVLIFVGALLAVLLLPVLVLVVGLVLLWTSPLWTRRERLIGTIVPAVGIGAFLPANLAILQDSSGVGLLGVVALAAGVAGVAALIWLTSRGFKAARAVDQEHPAPAKRRR